MSDTAIKLYDPQDDFQEMRQRDVLISTLRLQQFMSPGVTDGRFRAGQFAGDDTDVMIDFGEKATGAKVLPVIPVMFWLQWFEFNNAVKNPPKETRILNKSVDVNGELAKQAEAFVKVRNFEGREVVKVTEFYNFVFLFPTLPGGYDNLYVFGFAKSSHKIGKVFLNRMQKIRNAAGDRMNMWMNMFDLSAKIEEKNGNKFAIPVIGNASRVPEDKYEHLAGIATRLREQRLAVAERAAESADDSDAAPVASGEAPF